MYLITGTSTKDFPEMYLSTFQVLYKLYLKQKFTQYPAIHTNYSLSNWTTLNKKDFNRYSDFLVIN